MRMCNIYFLVNYGEAYIENKLTNLTYYLPDLKRNGFEFLFFPINNFKVIRLEPRFQKVLLFVL